MSCSLQNSDKKIGFLDSMFPNNSFYSTPRNGSSNEGNSFYGSSPRATSSPYESLNFQQSDHQTGRSSSAVPATGFANQNTQGFATLPNLFMDALGSGTQRKPSSLHSAHSSASTSPRNTTADPFSQSGFNSSSSNNKSFLGRNAMRVASAASIMNSQRVDSPSISAVTPLSSSFQSPGTGSRSASQSLYPSATDGHSNTYDDSMPPPPTESLFSIIPGALRVSTTSSNSLGLLNSLQLGDDSRQVTPIGSPARRSVAFMQQSPTTPESVKPRMSVRSTGSSISTPFQPRPAMTQPSTTPTPILKTNCITIIGVPQTMVGHVQDMFSAFGPVVSTRHGNMNDSSPSRKSQFWIVIQYSSNAAVVKAIHEYDGAVLPSTGSARRTSSNEGEFEIRVLYGDVGGGKYGSGFIGRKAATLTTIETSPKHHIPFAASRRRLSVDVQQNPSLRVGENNGAEGGMDMNGFEKGSNGVYACGDEVVVGVRPVGIFYQICDFVFSW